MTRLPSRVAVLLALLLLPAATSLGAGGGTLDPSFDGDGKLVVDATDAAAVAVRADGKIAVAGGGGNGFSVVLLNPDGSLDTAFGGDGKVEVVVASVNDSATAVVFDASGRIVVAGIAQADFAVARLNPDGTLDTSFAGDGTQQVTIVPGGFDLAHALAIDGAGRILIGGSSDLGLGGLHDFALIRLTATGALDTSFGGDGIVTTAFGAFGEEIRGVVVQPDGKIVAGGEAYVSNWDFGFARYLEDGSLDATFDGDGRTTVDFGSQDRPGGIALAGGGKIVAGGYSGPCCTDDFVAARLNVDGSLDPSFGGDGRSDRVDLGGRDLAYDLVVDPSDRVVLVGSKEAAGDFDWGIVRFAADGTLDTGFATNGIAPSPFATGFARAYGAALQTDGKFVVAGPAQEGVADGAGVVRYLSDAANSAPTASFTVTPSSGTTATSFAFDGTGSSDPDGDALTYAWAFGDGATATGATATHTYAVPGTYTATLTVDDGRGGTNATTRSVTVSSLPPANRSPAASFTVTPASGTTATSFSFDGSASSDPDGDALTYAWAFGDGSSGSGATAAHTYAAPGTYTATLTVDDGRGESDSTSRAVAVTAPPTGSPPPSGNRPPIASFEATLASAGGASTFAAAGSSDPDGDSLVFSWSFGDGGSASGSSVSHVYATPGTYTVQLTVADGRGGSATATKTIAISEPEQFVLSVRKVGGGRGAVRADGGLNCGTVCSATYPARTIVILQAVPAPGFTFRGWSGGCSGAGSTCQVTVAAATSATARFEPRRAFDPYSLVVGPHGGGAVATWEWGLSGAPIDCGRICADQFRRNSFVRLVAVPKYGFRFAGWRGACAGQGSWCRLQLSAARVTTPRFLPKPVTLTVTKSGEGKVATWEWGLDDRPVDCGNACSRRFQEGAGVRLTAVAAPGFELAGWSGACAGQGAWCSLVMGGPRETHATFVARAGTTG